MNLQYKNINDVSDKAMLKERLINEIINDNELNDESLYQIQQVLSEKKKYDNIPGPKSDIGIQADNFIFTNNPECCSLCCKSLVQCFNDSDNLIELGCHHTFCTQCLKKLAKDQIKNEKNINLRCPVCTFPLREVDIQNIDPKYVEILNQNFKNFVVEDKQLINCPKCHECFIYEQGDAAQITVDRMGEKIRPDALESLRKYRATCLKCKTVFCVQCNSIPFHEGFTCEEQNLLDNDIICRFCALYPAVGCEDLDPCRRICWRQACQEQLHEACMHVCECGHACCGLLNEEDHFGCALCEQSCALCVFCNSSCSTSPSVHMNCGHPAHKSCLLELYKGIKERGRIQIPRCNHDFKCKEVPFHQCVQEQALKWSRIERKIEEITLIKMKEENTENEQDHVNNPNDQDYYQQPLKYAHDFFEFYLCDFCRQPYYGGHKDCGRIENESDIEYRCPDCKRKLLHEKICPVHGDEGMVYKCMFCCNHSSFVCYGGTTYFCEECHKDAVKSSKGPFKPCDGKCKFAPHPPNGERIISAYCVKCEMKNPK